MRAARNPLLIACDYGSGAGLCQTVENGGPMPDKYSRCAPALEKNRGRTTPNIDMRRRILVRFKFAQNMEWARHSRATAIHPRQIKHFGRSGRSSDKLALVGFTRSCDSPQWLQIGLPLRLNQPQPAKSCINLRDNRNVPAALRAAAKPMPSASLAPFRDRI